MAMFIFTAQTFSGTLTAGLLALQETVVEDTQSRW